MFRVPRALGYHVAGVATGWIWLAVLVTGWALTLGLLVTFLGVFVGWALSHLVRAGALGEAALARSLLGARVQAPAPISGLAPGARLTDPAGWRAQAFGLSRMLVGFPLGVLVLALVVDGLGLVVAPLWYWTLPEGIQLGILDVDTLGLAFAVIPLGLVVTAAGCALAVATVAPLRRLAQWGLPAQITQAGRPVAVPDLDWRPVLRWTGGVAIVLETVVVVVWASTGRTSHWWAWAATGLAVPVGLAAVGVVKDRVPAGRRRALTAHGGLGLLVVLVCLSCWLLAGQGYFWPVWPALGFSAALGLHAVLPVQAQRELLERLERVEASRADVVDARDVELRRIERDLHDGAQARLVALTMELGRAEERLDADPAQARELMVGAQEHARAAIRELRDLARGIAPPVLADRGLTAAVQALAGTSHLSVAVAGDAGTPRPSLPVERTAYFVVAEGLTNAAKHAGPGTRVSVTLHRFARSLDVEIADDGPGGAVVGAGSGLSGLVARVEALDGALTVASPPGGGTTVRASIPCAP